LLLAFCFYLFLFISCTSGLIDREELAAAIIRFDRNHDPEFLDRVLEEENLTEMETDMTYPQVRT